MRAARALILPAVVLAVGGCEPAVSDETERARATVDAFRLACLRDDPVAVLHTLTEAQQASFLAADTTLAGCADTAAIDATFESTIRAALEASEIELSLAGDTGEALLATPETLDDGALALHSTGRSWQVHAPERER